MSLASYFVSSSSKADLDLGRAVDDVIVGHDIAVRRNDEAGTLALHDLRLLLLAEFLGQVLEEVMQRMVGGKIGEVELPPPFLSSFLSLLSFSAIFEAPPSLTTDTDTTDGLTRSTRSANERGARPNRRFDGLSCNRIGADGVRGNKITKS